MQLALMTEPHLGMTYDTLLGLARFAEDSGLVAFARSDHYAIAHMPELHTTDAFASVAGLARDTQRIELVVLVSPITFRHPAVIAKMAATIDEMSHGRLTLGVGTGWNEAEHTRFGIPFPDLDERFARLEEALGYLHHALGRAPGAFAGTHYSLADDQVRPRPAGLRLLVGGSGDRRTPRLAGTYADEYNFTLKPGTDLPLRISRAREAAERAGRDPNGLQFSLMCEVLVGATTPDFERILAREAQTDPWNATAAQIEAHHRERGYPIGTAAEVRERLAELEACGVSRLYVQRFGRHAPEELEETFGLLRDG
jgi:alkanesulfonate monooxygenase SsuD/methylene tetrahydromethanopterin reductase-like flavin-dependent oxidoreductase (luciferase family)